jgi:DNA (cytosine-5)-methyltransferase 1
MKYLSVCSGIEAATVAWHPLGWEPLAFSEIEPFPRKVLAHHYPDVPCHGDFTVLRDQDWIVDADLLVGGTPCQAFSVAGLRQSLSDDRGNLTLEFVRLADAIDDLRRSRGDKPAIIVWENVPGVLSVKDNAFGCFLAALVGNDAPLIPTGGKWTNAGMVIGPQRSAAWRILDAQYFGVAQRRRRVFVVAGSGDGFNPAEILFEREGMRRDTAPSRKAGEKSAPTVTNGPPFSRTGNDRVEADAYVVGALGARTGLSKGVQDATVGHMIVHGTQDPCVSDIAFAQGRNNGAENVLVQPIAFNSKDYGSDATTDMSPTLRSLGAYDANGGGSMAVAQPIAFDWKMGSKARSISINEDQSPTLGMQADRYAVTQAMAVRRLTPRECERLQGFPDDYTNIPKAADGPRYKALGNSMAVPVMRWIGQRVQKHNKEKE